jgi:hypothetical protein
MCGQSDLKHSVFQIYVLPPIDKIPESHPHAEKINKLVAEEKSKLEDVSQVMSKRQLATKEIPQEDLTTQHKKSVQAKHLTDKENISSDKTNQYISPEADSGTDVPCTRMTDHRAGNKTQHPENLSVSTTVQIGGLEGWQQISEMKAGSFVPLVGGVSPQFNSTLKMQTCSQCHKLLCGDAMRKVSSESMKVVCKKCTDNCTALESNTTDKVVTLYRCGMCFMDFLERDILAKHMDEKHKVPPEPVSGIESKTSADFVSCTDTSVTSQTQDSAMPANMGILCPPANLLLQPLPVTFTSQNILLNTAPLFTLQPSNEPAMLTAACQTSAVAVPKNFISGSDMSLQTPAEVLADPGKVLLPVPVPKVAIPKLNSMSKATDNSKILAEESPMGKMEVRTSNNQSPK